MPILDAKFDQVRREVETAFPFSNYLHDGLKSGQWRTVAEVVSRNTPEGGRVLDFGCGPCDAPAVLSRLGFESHAGDDLQDHWHLLPGVREKILGFARATGVHFTLLEGRGPLPWPDDFFDTIMLHHVLEHFADSPRDLMNALIAKLKSGGVIFVTVPSAVNIRKRIAVARGRTNYPPYEHYYWFPGPWRGHHREYVRSDLEQMCGFTGLEVVELSSYHFMLHRVPKKVRGVYKALTAMFPGWRDSWLLVARKPKGWTPRTEIPAGSPLLSQVHMTGRIDADAAH